MLAKVLKLAISFVFAFTWCFLLPNNPAFAANEKTSAKFTQQGLTEKNLKDIFARYKNVGMMLRAIQSLSSKEDYEAIRKLVLSSGLTEDYTLTSIEIEKTFLQIKPGMRLNLAHVDKGVIGFGSLSFSRKDFRNEEARFKALVDLVVPSSRKSSSLNRLFIEQANAEQSWADRLKELGLMGTAFFLSVHTVGAVAMGIAAMLEGSVLAGAGATAAGVLVFGLIIETLWKASGRYATGTDIYCENGELYIRSQRFTQKIPTQFASLKNAGSNDAGWLEWKFRELLCNSKEALAKMNQMVNSAMEKVGEPAKAKEATQ